MKREYLSWFIICGMFLYFFGGAFAFIGSGSGTEEDPFQITTCEELQDINNSLDSYYVLSNPVDCGGFDFKTIGATSGTGNDREIIAFTGSLDGQGFAINDLTIQRCYIPCSSCPKEVYPGTYSGLFGKLSTGASVSNLKLVNLNNAITCIGAYNFRGGIVGVLAGGTISDCFVNGSMENRFMGTYAGGIAGHLASGNIIRSATNVSIHINNIATSTLYGDMYAGGIVGHMGSGKISDSYSRGSVAAFTQGEGNVAFLGGLVGRMGGGKIIHSYSTGAVGLYGGGLVDYKYGGTVNNSYWDKITSGRTTSGTTQSAGTGKITEEMKIQDTFEDWDFENVWKIDFSINDGYPHFIYSAGGGDLTEASLDVGKYLESEEYYLNEEKNITYTFSGFTESENALVVAKSLNLTDFFSDNVQLLLVGTLSVCDGKMVCKNNLDALDNVYLFCTYNGQFTTDDSCEFQIPVKFISSNVENLSKHAFVDYINSSNVKNSIELSNISLTYKALDCWNDAEGICSVPAIAHADKFSEYFCETGSCYVCNKTAGYGPNENFDGCELKTCASQNGVCANETDSVYPLLFGQDGTDNPDFICEDSTDMCFVCSEDYHWENDNREKCIEGSGDPMSCLEAETDLGYGACHVSSASIPNSAINDSFNCDTPDEVCYFCKEGFEWEDYTTCVSTNPYDLCTETDGGVCVTAWQDFWTVNLNRAYEDTELLCSAGKCYFCNEGFNWNSGNTSCLPDCKSKDINYFCSSLASVTGAAKSTSEACPQSEGIKNCFYCSSPNDVFESAVDKCVGEENYNCTDNEGVEGVCSEGAVAHAVIDYTLSCQTGFSCYVCNSSEGFGISDEGDACELNPDSYCYNNGGTCANSTDSRITSLTATAADSNYSCPYGNQKCYVCPSGKDWNDTEQSVCTTDPYFDDLCVSNEEGGFCFNLNSLPGADFFADLKCNSPEKCFKCKDCYMWDIGGTYCIPVCEPESLLCEDHDGSCYGLFGIFAPKDSVLASQYKCDSGDCYVCPGILTLSEDGEKCVEEEVDDALYECVSDSYQSFWREIAHPENKLWVYKSSANPNDLVSCFSDDGEWCCPDGFICEEGTCYEDSFGESCSFLSEENCDGASGDFAINEIDFFPEKYDLYCTNEPEEETNDDGSVCQTLRACNCFWDSEKQKCGVNFSVDSTCENVEEGTCEWVDSEPEDLCESEGYLLVMKEAYGDAEFFCDPIEVQYPCSTSVSLPFFGWISFFVSLAVIFIFYMRLNKLNFANRFK